MTSLARKLALVVAGLTSIAVAPATAAAGKSRQAAPPAPSAEEEASDAESDSGEDLPPIMQDEDARRARREAQRARGRERREAAATRPPPTEAELGAPVYPGARFDPRNSAGMSSGDMSIWLFLSEDPPEKVAAFYQKKLGKAPEVIQDYRMFVLKGRPPIPEHGLLVEPNREKMYPPPTRTVISVQKQQKEQ